MNDLRKKVKERLDYFISQVSVSVSSFEKKCGLSNGYVKNFRGNFGSAKLDGILNAFPNLNKDWLLYGEGEMLKSGASYTFNQNNNHGNINNLGIQVIEEQTVDDSGIINVEEIHKPIVPAQLVKAEGVDVVEYVEKHEERLDSAPAVLQFSKFDLFLDNPSDAMAPTIIKGDRIAIKIVDKDAPIIGGEVYVVDSNQLGIFVRILRDRGDKVLCVAKNQQEYDDFYIDKSDINNLFRIVGMIRQMI